MSLKIEVENPRRDLAVVNYFHKLALVKGESVALESTLCSREHRRQWIALGGQVSGARDSIAGIPWHDHSNRRLPVSRHLLLLG